MTDETKTATITQISRAACLKGVSHGAFRLYTILSLAACEKSAADRPIAVTLSGLMALHPGVGGRPIGVTTVINQMHELRRSGLLDIQGTMHRLDPGSEVVVQVLTSPHEAPDVTAEIDRKESSI